MKRVLLGIGILAVASIFLTWWFSDGQVLKRRIHSMLETAEVPAAMSDAGRKARGGHLAGYLATQIEFTPPKDFDLPVSSPIGRDTAAAVYSGAASYAKEITFTEITVTEVQIHEADATVTFTADTIIDLRSRRPIDGVMHVDSSWTKVEGKWLLKNFTWNEVPR